MNGMITKMLATRKDWKQMEARADALPRDHRVVYGELKTYLWNFTAGDGTDVVEVLRGVLAELEAGAAAGRSVLEVTGEDVVAYADRKRDGLVPGFVAGWRTTLAENVRRQL